MFALECGAGVLLLDEPTANLDVRAEAALYDRFLDLTAGLTTIVVSHRFSTVRRADRIVVLEGGRIVESGSHDELLALNGRYARMFDLQARYYSEAPVIDAPKPASRAAKPAQPIEPKQAVKPAKPAEVVKAAHPTPAAAKAPAAPRAPAAPKATAAPKAAAANGNKPAAAPKSVKATAEAARTAVSAKAAAAKDAKAAAAREARAAAAEAKAAAARDAKAAAEAKAAAAREARAAAAEAKAAARAAIEASFAPPPAKAPAVVEDPHATDWDDWELEYPESEFAGEVS
jgi:ATP-binding cassette subfamily B protein